MIVIPLALYSSRLLLSLDTRTRQCAARASASSAGAPNRIVKDVVIPSEEYHVKMFPMDFEEFAWATGNGAMLPIIERRFNERLPIGADTHCQIMDIFRQYLVVGGMPQVVETFATTHDLGKVEFEKRNILSLYRADIHKFAGALKEKVASETTTARSSG